MPHSSELLRAAPSSSNQFSAAPRSSEHLRAVPSSSEQLRSAAPGPIHPYATSQLQYYPSPLLSWCPSDILSSPKQLRAAPSSSEQLRAAPSTSEHLRAPPSSSEQLPLVLFTPMLCLSYNIILPLSSAGALCVNTIN